MQTKGILCISCGMECEHAYTYDDLEAVTHYMRKTNCQEHLKRIRKQTIFLDREEVKGLEIIVSTCDRRCCL